VSFLALPDADEYPITPLMICLCLVSMSEGLDASLFPAVTATLETEENFRVATLGYIATFQLIFQAFGGPMWGILASRAILPRKNILIICTFFQGLATMIMWYWIQNIWMLCALRAVNGVMLAGLRPIANSIVGDRFDDSVRGKYFGYVMGCMQLGVAIGTGAAQPWSDQVIFNGLLGWKVAFLAIGGFTALLAPLIAMVLRAPPVIVQAASKDGSKEGEFWVLLRLLRRPTFAMLVFQGCFGLIPWRAFDFRNFFLEKVGVPKGTVASIGIAGGLGACLGSYLGGPIGDGLNKVWPHHGRVLTAEMAVYGGIPIAYFSFMVRVAADYRVMYYGILTVALGLIATWTPAGTNSPILCSLAEPHERALILSWQTSLEGSIGALGPILFAFLLEDVFGYNTQCNKEEFELANPELCNNIEAAGNALFWCSCGPWAICGMMYSSLHYTFPRDLANIERERTALQGEGTEIVGGMM